MLAYQERVVEEKQELDKKIDALGKISKTAFFSTLPKPEQDRLQRQFHVMQEYSVILGERIAAFKQ